MIVNDVQLTNRQSISALYHFSNYFLPTLFWTCRALSACCICQIKYPYVLEKIVNIYTHIIRGLT
jgi:hypothetical protein